MKDKKKVKFKIPQEEKLDYDKRFYDGSDVYEEVDNGE